MREATVLSLTHKYSKPVSKCRWLVVISVAVRFYRTRVVPFIRKRKGFSHSLLLHLFPINHSHPRHTDVKFELVTSDYPGRPILDEILVYRLPSNHCRSKKTDLQFEFLASKYQWDHRHLSQLLPHPALFFWPGYKKNTDRQAYLISLDSTFSRGN